MTSITTTLRQLLLANLLWPAAQAMANDTKPEDGCRFLPYPKAAASQSKTHIRDMGTFYIPRDARVGTLIGPPRSRASTPDLSALQLNCSGFHGGVMWFHARASRGIHPDLPPIDNRDYNGHVLRTNVPGIGAIVEFGMPFLGNYRDTWFPVGNNPPLVPFSASHTNSSFMGVLVTSLINTVTLVKTGDIPPGAWEVGGELMYGEVDHDLPGKVLTFELKANVIQTQCSTVGDPVSANPVRLGDWSAQDFTGPGFTTPDVPFQIRLGSCLIDPDPGNITQATIELNGIDGSGPIGPIGHNVFSLTNDSGARGIGIQMLYNDLPMPLNSELPLQPVEDGSTLLKFKARYYQTDPSSAVRAGLAKGALNFTVRFR